jgi:hypothetical protein
MVTASSVQNRLKGDIFEAHVCSKGCTCDPCTCDPCNCGSGRADDFPDGPLWKITGYHIVEGQLQGSDVSNLTFIKLALTSGTGANDDWQEYLLLAHNASKIQVAALVEALHTGTFTVLTASKGEVLPLYQVPLEYRQKDAQRAQLHIDFTHLASLQVSGDPAGTHPDWVYQRHVALQKGFDLHK